MEEQRLKEIVREAVREELREWEKARAARRFRGALLGFFVHLGLYVVVNLGATIYVLAKREPYFWPVWPIVFWGAGVATHLVGLLALRRAARA